MNYCPLLLPLENTSINFFMCAAKVGGDSARGGGGGENPATGKVLPTQLSPQKQPLMDKTLPQENNAIDISQLLYFQWGLACIVMSHFAASLKEAWRICNAMLLTFSCLPTLCLNKALVVLD